MAIYTYTQDVHSVDALTYALVKEGVFDGAVSMVDSQGVKTTSVDTTAAKSAVDAAIVSASTGGLIHAQYVKIHELKALSSSLTDAGVSAWGQGTVPCTKEDAERYYVDYLYYQDHPSAIGANTPYYVETLEGKGAVTELAADILALSEACAARIQYIYSSVSNADGSKGELQYTQDVLACVTIAEVDAITDTRS